ncbi:MAG TPA: PQQ-binding-like beta-propeller repeat protein [Gemmataceae bacterium]|jgi:outer membrane protein assembly factor BamB|nr:PQQ-binding-like beta-propeller repeat protein [Gemmataceae bacterium]
MPIRLPLFAVLAVSVVAMAADNWPEFRGPHGDGHSDATSLPTTWSEAQNVRWKTAIHDKGWSSPVVWGNQVWLTTATETGDKLYAVGVDRETGKVIHDVLLFEIKVPPRPAKKTSPSIMTPYEEWAGFNSYASPSPATEEGRVYAHFGSAGTACLDTATGKVLWKREDLKCGHHRGAGSSPILYANLVILTFDGFDVQYLVALDKATGKTVWQKDRQFHPDTMNGDMKKAYSTPLVISVEGKPLLVSPSAGATAAYDPMTGDEVWRVVHGGMNAGLRPIFGQGLVFTASSDGGKQLMAIKPNGTGNVTNSNIAWTFDKGAPNRTSFLVSGDNLLMVNSGGIARCVGIKDGKERKNIRLETRGANVWASPILAEGKWYVFDDAGNSFVLSADEKLDVIATNKLDGGGRASPAAVGHALYHRTFTHLYRIEASK